MEGIDMGANVELIDAIRQALAEVEGKKKLPCAEAFRLAEEFDVSKAQIGQICNDNNIKISHCQIGCFK